jgi:hypothetical protein
MWLNVSCQINSNVYSLWGNKLWDENERQNGKSLFFFFSLVLLNWQVFISSLVMKLDFISQLSSKSTLPFAGLQHMQQCQVNLFQFFLLQAFNPNDWCLKNGLLSGGLNPRTLSHESSALTTRPRLMALFD